MIDFLDVINDTILDQGGVPLLAFCMPDPSEYLARINATFRDQGKPLLEDETFARMEGTSGSNQEGIGSGDGSGESTGMGRVGGLGDGEPSLSGSAVDMQWEGVMTGVTDYHPGDGHADRGGGGANSSWRSRR